ncbi:SulP family inorganic anion transporter [Streptomyces sp. S.PB5]|nr:SulP family inorganic anion transporter [Streptomyces sp. S.PB5]MDN3027845.1 SulP family inorganic anion transporter [Streptomyces sp. S.PB5]
MSVPLHPVRDLAQTRRDPRRDLLAGLTVAVVALPLALGFGVSSGLGAEAGPATAVVAEYATTPDAIRGARHHLERAGVLSALPGSETRASSHEDSVR